MSLKDNTPIFDNNTQNSATNQKSWEQNFVDIMRSVSRMYNAWSFENKHDNSTSETDDLNKIWTNISREAVDLHFDCCRYWVALGQAISQEAAKAKGTTTSQHNHKKHDKNFLDPEWEDTQYFRLLKDNYLSISKILLDTVNNVDGVDESRKAQFAFYMKQLTSAISPANSLYTNPEVLRRTVTEKGGNLARGFAMMADDIENGKGLLKVRQSASNHFEVGRNLAVTPGKVIAQNHICQVICYEPTTESVYKHPLLIVPPWINKYYILDLTPEKSFVQWCVSQGYTVFMISWVNPQSANNAYSFEEYLQDGIIYSLDTITRLTKESQISALGYCIGGTLLAIAMSYAASTGDNRIHNASFLTTQINFARHGDIGPFIDDIPLALLESHIQKQGYLSGVELGMLFNMLKPNELLWPFFVKNYLLGDEPAPFDILHWNGDHMNIPGKNHIFYLRNLCHRNEFYNGTLQIRGVDVKPQHIKSPLYFMAAKNDHIVPPEVVLDGLAAFGGPVEFVLGGSGHVAGVVNPPSFNKYQYWTNDQRDNYAKWRKEALEVSGSWWCHWLAWMKTRNSEMIPVARDGFFDAIKDATIDEAPGSYVRV